MEITGIHHVAIIAGDYQRSKRFYIEVLGFKVLGEHYRPERQSYKLDLRGPGGIQFEVFSFPVAPPRVSRPEACGLRHVAFSVEDLDTVLQQLRAHQVAFEPVRVDEFTGQRFTFFMDPDGLPLELYEASVRASIAGGV